MTCYLCGGKSYKLIAEKEGIRFGCFGTGRKIVQCLECGLIQLVPPWSDKELDELYSAYWQKEDFPGQKPKVKISEYLTDFLKKEESILEVGCGLGDNIKYLTGKGYKVAGIDKDPDSYGTIADYKDYSADVDVIYAIHLFEHLPDPYHFIDWMLEHSHRFVLEVPIADNPLLALKRFRPFYWYPYHLFFYGKKTIKRLFEKCNLSSVRFIVKQEYGIINHLRWLFLGKPGNWNPHVPVIDDIYKFFLTKILGIGDTIIVIGEK
jgi:SAM-dependent methyltransferase